MKNEIIKLIQSGHTEEALDMLPDQGDYILLKARFALAKRQYHMGLIDFGEWSRILNQVNDALLKMTFTDEHNPPKKPLSAPNQPQVFISYNHKDELQAELLRDRLEQEGIVVLIDFKMPAGMRIDDFISESLAQSNFLVPLISANSLSSGWVSKEVTAGFLLQNLQSKKVVPIMLDKSVFEPEFYLKTGAEVNQKIEKIILLMKSAIDLTGDPRAYQDDLSLQRDLQSNLAAIIQTLKGVKMIDLTEGRFRTGIEDLIVRIKQG